MQAIDINNIAPSRILKAQHKKKQKKKKKHTHTHTVITDTKQKKCAQ